MPTGYTADIKDGISFEQFTMNCARAFGATIDMRDEPKDAEIPDQFEPSTYHKDSLDKARAELASIYALTNVQADDRAAVEHQGKERRRKKLLDDKNRQRESYESMLARVHAWTPPTDEHLGLKNFMIQQIESSIDFDCNNELWAYPEPALTGSEWREKKIANLKWQIEYHEKNHAEEVERTENRNAWIRALRNSLTESA